MKDFLLSLPVFAVLAGLFWMVGHDGRLPWEDPPSHGADWCEPHGAPLSTCEKCNPKLVRGGTVVTRDREAKEGECPNTLVKIVLGPGVAEQAGIETTKVETRPVSETIVANAETRYDPTKYARVSPRLPGVVREVAAILGQEVAAGAVLAVLDSVDLGQAKADLLRARAVLALREKNVERLAPFAEGAGLARREIQQAQGEVDEARLDVQRESQRLVALGVPKDEVARVSADDPDPTRTEVRAPFAGVVLESSAVVGEASSPDRPLFSVADVARLWMRIDVAEADLAKIEKGQRASFAVDGMPGKKFTGKVLSIGPEVDDRTRTVPVIADVKNAEGLLRANMFGTGEIRVKTAEPRLLVPKEAVQNDGDCWLVFTSATKDVFHARKIEIRTAYRDGYEVVGGLAAGETVATTGSFLLKTEVMRGQMGAG